LELDIIHNFESSKGLKGFAIKQDYWISRSSSADGFIFARANNINGGMINVLTIKRSKTMQDEPDKYCVPCGYFDWDENGYEAMIRELYEETTLYLPDYKEFNIFDNYQQSFCTITHPSNNRQNIELMYIAVLEFGDDKDSFPMFIENYSNNEITEVKWMSWYDFVNASNDLEWAFNHNIRIHDALLYYNTGQFNMDFFNKEMLKRSQTL